MQDKTNQYKTHIRQSRAIPYNTIHYKTRLDNRTQSKSRHCEIKQDKTRQYNTTHDNTRQDQTRQYKTIRYITRKKRKYKTQ